MMRMFADYPKFFIVNVGLLLAMLAVAAVRPRTEQPARAAAIYGAVILALTAGAQIVFYEVDGWRELRIFAPAHALAGLMFLSYARVEAWTAPTTEVVIGAALLLIVLNGVFTTEGLEQKYWSNWTHRTEAIDQDGKVVFAALEPYFEFHSVDSSFCKTVYGDSEVLSDPRLVYLPDGFALSVVEPAAGHLPVLGGKYALVKTPGRDLHSKFDWDAAFSASSDWRRIAGREDLTLFRSTVNCLP
jgi:hypothetical protein